MAKILTMRITFIRTAVLAVAVVVALLSSGQCEASCGDYVYSRYRTPTHHVPEIRQHVALNDHGILNTELARPSKVHGFSHDASPELPVPCDGPGCRQNPTPSMPVAPLTVIGSGHQDRLICSRPDVELPSDVSHRRDLKNLARALRGFPLLIEMPPEFVG